MTPPMMGATQNSQSCVIAPPPANSATAVERAGFTDVLVTGIEIRWISVSARPMAIGAKPAGRVLVGGAQDHHQEHGGEHHFGDEGGEQANSPPANARHSRWRRSRRPAKPALPLAMR